VPKQAASVPHKAAAFPPPGVGEFDERSSRYFSKDNDKSMYAQFYL
jgi:hypothetical protein